MSVNVFTFSGRLGRDAETRFTTSGKAVTGFPVAVDVGFGDRKHALWVDCSMWGERGQNVAQYLRKGGTVTVTGEADLETYQNHGVERTKLKCRVNDVELPPPARQDRAPAPPRAAAAPQPSPGPADGSFEDDDIPF